MFKVITRDVDGKGSRTYRTRAAAVRRFEEMYGNSFNFAVAEDFCDSAIKANPETIKCVRAVSDYGTVVIFKQLEE